MIQTLTPPIIRSHPLFAGLSEGERSLLLEDGKLQHYEAGQSLFVLGDAVKSFYVLCEGAAQVYRTTPDGHELTAEVLLPGDMFGAGEILQENPTQMFNGRVIRTVTTMEFHLTWLKDNIQCYPALALNLLAALSRRADASAIESEHQAKMTAAQQVVCFLQRLCSLHGYDPHGFDLPYSKTLIASRLGMELETFSRALAKIRNHGVAVNGAKVAFIDFRKAEHFSCASCSLIGHCQEREILRRKMQHREDSLGVVVPKTERR